MATPSLLDTATGYQNGDVITLTPGTYTVPGGGANLCFVCILLGRSNMAVSSISLNGVSLLPVKIDNGSSDVRALIYALVAPTTGTLTGTLSAQARWGMIYFTLQDVDQTTPTRAGAGTAHDGSLGASISTGAFTTVVGDLVIGGAASRDDDAADFTIPAGGTSLLATLTIDPGGGVSRVGTNATSIVASGTSTNLTWSTADVNRKGCAGVPFVGASGGATVGRLVGGTLAGGVLVGGLLVGR